MISEKICRIFESGDKSNVLTAEIYLSWIDVCKSHSAIADLNEIIQRASLKFPENSHLLEKKVACLPHEDVC